MEDLFANFSPMQAAQGRPPYGTIHKKTSLSADVADDRRFKIGNSNLINL